MTPVNGRAIALWVETRDGAPAVNPVMRAVLAALENAGARARVVVPEQQVVDPADRVTDQPDLVLLKSATSFALSVAIADEAAGVRFLNPARATWRAHDKAATVGRLAAAGLPVPATFLAVVDQAPIDPSGLDGPWVSKPVRGVHGRGVIVHEVCPATLGAGDGGETDDAFIVDDGTRLIQRRIGGDEPDLKVYVADGRCFAGRKPFSAASYRSDRIKPVEVDAAVRGIALAAGEALGLTCFGVDLRFDGERPTIIDVNPFPGFRGFPGAVPALLAEIERALASS